MWKIIEEPSLNSEPQQLRNLKQLLIKNRCQCEICARENRSVTYLNKDKVIQVQDTDSLILSTATSTRKVRCIRSLNDFSSCRAVTCPGCFVAMNLLHRQYLKDEVSETNPHMFSCNKSTDKVVLYSDKSISFNDKLDSVKFKPVINEFSSDRELKSRIEQEIKQKDNINCVEYKENCQTRSTRECVCMENFINSIRPPLAQM